MARAAALACLLVLAAGCAGRKKDTAEPPAELVDFETTLDVRKVWSSKVGDATERLRLALGPATDGERVYAGAHDGQVAAFDAATGGKVWSVKTRLPLSAGPAFGDGLLAFGTTDGSLLAIDAATGAERWRVAVGSEVLARPAIAPNVVVLRTVDGRLRGFAARDGEELWSVEQQPPALTVRGNTAPRVAGAIVVSGFDNGRIGAYEVATGEVIWEVTIATPTGRSELDRLVDVSTAIELIGNEVYAVSFHGRVLGIDLNTGLTLWEQDMSSYAGVGADADNVYVTNDFDAVIALDRRGGTQRWQQEALRLRGVTAATRYGNAVVVGDFAGFLHWLDPTDGRLMARARAAGDRISAAPLLVGANLLVQGDDGLIAAFAVRNDDAGS